VLFYNENPIPHKSVIVITELFWFFSQKCTERDYCDIKFTLIILL